MMPTFLRASKVDEAITFLPLERQTITILGSPVPVITNIPVIPVALVDKEEGEIWATYTIILKEQGWYAAHSQIFKITDSLGMIVTVFTDHLHKKWADMYKDYLETEVDFNDEVKSVVEEKVEKVSTLLYRLQHDKRLKPPTIENDGWYVDTDLWYFLMRCYSKKKNLLLVGSSGCGKSELVMFMMSKIGKPISVFDMAVSNPNKTFCGNLRVDNGTTHYQLARFAREIQNEGMVLMDELSRASPMANNILLPMLDGRRTLYIEDAIDKEHGQIKVNPKCALWATANIGAEFIGTNALDHALLNRFQQVGVTYPPQDKESLLLQKRYSLSKRTSDAVVKVAHEIRANLDISKDVSTRQLFEIADMIKDGYAAIDAFKWTVLQQFESNEHDGGERQTVLAILQSL